MVNLRVASSGGFGMKAYVLVNLQTLENADVVDMMRRVKGVTAADVTLGPYDAVATVEAGDINTLGRIIVREIRTLPGVQDTITCLAVDSVG
jgi:DNA-binding Lrp family transcriptional regulator